MALHNHNGESGEGGEGGTAAASATSNSSAEEDSPAEDCFHDAISEEAMTDVNSSSNTSSLNYQRLHSNPVTPTTSTTNSTPTPTTDCDHHHTTTITTDSHHPLIATSPSNNSIALALTVDFELRESLALHRAVFERTPSKDLADMIDDWASRAPNKPMAEIVSVKDVHGNTPLHLAIMTGQKHTVQLLLSRDAPIKSRNAAGWTPLDEAISYGDRAMIRRILKSGRKQARRSMQSRRPKLIDALSRIPDFTMDLRWEFYSWVPIVKRFLPSDTCTLSKRGSSIRLDTTLVDFSDRSWQRGNITFIFNGEAKSDHRHGGGGKALTVLDNELKVYQSVKYSGHSSDIEEDIDILMSSDIIYPMMSTKSITFTRAQAGWWFSRYNRTEQVGQFEADFYNINGLVMESRKRREHLSEEDVQSNRQLIETLKRSMDNPKGGNGGNGGSGTSPSASTTELLDMAAMAGGAEEDGEEEEGELVNINGEKFPQKTPEKTSSKAQAAKQQQGTKKASTKKESTKKTFNESSVVASPPLSSEKKLPNGGAALTSSKTKKENGGSFTEGSSAEDEDDEDEDEDEDEYDDEDEFEEEAQSKQSKSKPSGRESRSSKNNSGGQTSEPSTPTSASIKALESTASHSFRRRRSLPPPAPPSTPITWQAYIRAPRGHPPCLARPLKSKTSTRTFKATLAMSRDFPLSIESLLNVLEVVAPFKHFKKLNEFVRLNLPPGFPVKIDIPVIPAVLARVTFLNFTFKTDIPEALFEVPADYTEDPSRFPDI